MSFGVEIEVKGVVILTLIEVWWDYICILMAMNDTSKDC